MFTLLMMCGCFLAGMILKNLIIDKLGLLKDAIKTKLHL